MTTCSPVEDAMTTLARVLTASRERTDAPALRAMLAEAGACLEQLGHTLDRLDDFGLLCGGGLAERMRGARTVWSQFAAGRRVSELSELIATSPVLSDLVRAAVTITGMTRFSDRDVAVARRLGCDLRDFPHYVNQLASTAQSGDGAFLIAPAAAHQLERTLAWLENEGVLSGFRIEFSHGAGNGAKWIPKAKGRMPAHSRSWRVVRGTVAEEFRALLSGHWLTAYAAWIAADQFERSGADYEIYTNVEYELPPDLGGGRSDIDVLIRTEDLLVCIEVKAGNLVSRFGSGRTALEKTVADAERLEAVFRRLGLGLERRFPLVYTGRTADAAALVPPTDARVTLLTPAEIRVAIERMGRAA